MKARYLRLYERLRKAILEGDYVPGTRLPSKRALADETGTSVITVEHAYALLCDEGYVEARERSGFFVAQRGNDRETPLPSHRQKPPRRNNHRVDTTFPFSVAAKKIRAVISRYGERMLIKSPNNGTAELREAIASYLARARDLRVRPSQIIVGSGAEYLYGLLAQFFTDDSIAIERPSYAKIQQVYEAHGVSCEGLDLGTHGILSEELHHARSRILHVTPYRSFPTDVTADSSKRREYVQWAQTESRILIEDDFDSEFSSARRGAETLFAIDGGRHVIYLNTFSKTLSPAMRIGYLVLPTRILADFTAKVGFYSCTVPVLDQLFLADFINDGDFERHLNRCRRRLQNSRQ